jgi:hypothetical protein
MFSLFKKKKNGIWDGDRLFDLDSGILLAEIMHRKVSNVYQIYYWHDVTYPYSSDKYQTKDYAMIAAEKFYNIKYSQIKTRKDDNKDT